MLPKVSQFVVDSWALFRSRDGVVHFGPEVQRLGRLRHRNWTRSEGAFAPRAVLPASRLTMYSNIDVLITLQVCNCPSFEKGSEVRMIDMACVAAGMVFCTRDGFLQVKPSSDSDVVPGRL
jgi:hypothetical protein